MSDFLSFNLSDDFVEEYSKKPVNWGFPIHDGLSLGELTYISKYSRIKDDGTKERWYETCRRIIEGMFSIQKDWCRHNRTPWNDHKAQRAARDAYDRLFHFKWTPPGRGMWAMGTRMVHEKNNSAALYNCAWISTEKITSHSKYEATLPFVRLMEMSMWGIGVGFDTRGAGKITLQEPAGETEVFVVPDTREGWAESIGRQLASYFLANQKPVTFDYSLVRAAGSPLKTFGGTASGPGPLKYLHDKVDELIGGRAGEKLTSRDIVDIQNLIGKAVVAGGARRSAELALGDINDEEYINLKNWELPENAERTGMNGWAWMSNNSVYANVDSDLDHIIDSVVVNGEPGIVWMDVARQFGRTADPRDDKDMKSTGVNPCAEIILESHELCCLAETYVNNADSLEDFLATCKVAMLYAKTVTLVPTPWPETNEVIVRNRRIGVSKTGTAQFAESSGWNTLGEWDRAGYDYICKKDAQYSEWLGVRESIRKTTSKPAGSTSLLAGCAPGVHWPTNAGIFLRRMRFHVNDPIVTVLEKAGYHVEPDNGDPEYTVVAEFPVDGLDMRSEREVSIWEKAELAAFTQRWWADNAVSVTVTFREDERDQIKHLLRSKAGQFKTISFLPLTDDGVTYAQAPFEPITHEKADEIRSSLKKVNLKAVYDGGKAADATDSKFCDTDSCELDFTNVVE
jgi:ribonucleoside-triphosphate reductase